jgi:chromosome segregation ATPase
MKNNVLIIIVFILSTFAIIYSFKENDVDTFIKETRKEVETIEKDREVVFEMADKTIEMMESDKKEIQFKLDSLDVELYEKQKIVNSFLRSIKDSEKLKCTLEEQNKILKQEQIQLKESLNKVLDDNHQTNEKLEKMYSEKEFLEYQYKNLTKSYDSSIYYHVDTVYIIDTLIYRKEDIKKLILKK